MNDPHEISLDENVTRSDMHPADQFEAFKRLAEEKGWGPEEIGARFGVSAHIVRQRLRLASVSPRLIDIYRAGDLHLDQLMAFGVCDDHARQEQVYETLTWNRNPVLIRRAMTETKVPVSDRRAVFVGVEAYAEAGGTVLRDLFTEDGGGWLEDVGLLDRLAAEKLHALASELRDAEGWKWGEAHLDYPSGHDLSRVYPHKVDRSEAEEQRAKALAADYDRIISEWAEAEDIPPDVVAQLRTMEAELAAHGEAYAFAPDEIARGSVFVILNQDGTARIERGLIRPEDLPPPEPAPEALTGDDPNGNDAELGGEAPDGGVEPDDEDDDGGLAFARRIDCGMHEDVEITNYASEPVCFNLELAIRSDFADLFEVKSKAVIRRGDIAVTWSSKSQSLTTTYTNKDFSRAIRIRASAAGSLMTYANGRLSFNVALDSGAVWRACLLYDFADGETWTEAPDQCLADPLKPASVRDAKRWKNEVLKVETSNDTFATAYSQAIDDMSALRLPIEGTDHIQFVPAAGLPWFVALFGRDSLIISLQNAIVHPEFALGALKVLAQWQATERDDYRDAEPGKIHHELRRGELAHFKLIPHTPYYGTADATPLYLITLHSAWMSIGDKDLLSEHIDTAERCLDWIDQYGDRDGDGFQEYETRSPVGYANQGWKDSGDAVMNVDGSLVKGPKALCELQGYVYDAWVRMAQIYDALDRPDRAKALRAKASSLFERFNATFWSETEGYYAFALDGDKRPVWSVASNPGQCLWSGIVPPDRARRVAERLKKPDMWSGWGIRTLSADHKSFNPYNYQTGAVWPHDNGFIAHGLKRYGLHEETCAVAESVMRAVGYFAMDQLPELYAGTQRDDSNFPVQYLGANVPQGWAAGSIFSLLQAMLGFQPDAPGKMLYVDPHLPAWMPDLTVRDLRLGSTAFDIRFVRSGERTQFEVTKGPKDRVALKSMKEWSAALTDPREARR